ncbi:MAG: hypothetical protein ACREE4_03685 [Stellaceae bacterium]
MRPPSYASLDEVLEALAPYGIELDNGNSNHAPMVAEALASWAAVYQELPATGARAMLRPRQAAPGANPGPRAR